MTNPSKRNPLTPIEKECEINGNGKVVSPGSALSSLISIIFYLNKLIFLSCNVTSEMTVQTLVTLLPQSELVYTVKKVAPSILGHYSIDKDQHEENKQTNMSFWYLLVSLKDFSIYKFCEVNN